eukprot:3322582-Rhodomonas_salina.4
MGVSVRPCGPPYIAASAALPGYQLRTRDRGSGMSLCEHYALSSTGASHGTDRVYGHTPCLVLRARMVLPGLECGRKDSVQIPGAPALSPYSLQPQTLDPRP